MAKQEKMVARIQGEAPVIDVSKIPEHEMDLMCRTLIPAVKELFKDPAVREDFEKWKAARAARLQQADQGEGVSMCNI